MKKLLFICSRNKLRSPTAEQIFSQYSDFEVISAGLNNDSIYQLCSEDIEWADYIFVMEMIHKRKLLSKYKKFINNNKIIVLNIPDNYDYMDKELVEILKSKVERFF